MDPNDEYLSAAFIRTPEGFATINFQDIGEQKGFRGNEAILQGRNDFLSQIGADQNEFQKIRTTGSVASRVGTIKTRNIADFFQGLYTQFGVGPNDVNNLNKRYGADVQGFIGALQSTQKGGGNISQTTSPINPQGAVVSVDGKQISASPSIQETLKGGGATPYQAQQLGGVQTGQPFTPQQLAQAGYQSPATQTTSPGQQFKTVTDPSTGRVSSTVVGQQGQMTPQQIQQGIDTAKQKAGEIQTGIDRLKTGGVNATQSGQALATTFNQPKASDVIKNIEAALASSLLKEEQDVTKVESQIEGILSARKGATQLLQEEFERRGITEQKSILKEFDKRIKNMNKEIRDIPEKLQRTLEDVGVTQSQLDRLALRDTTKSMRVLTDFMEERNAFADEVNEAVGFAQQFVNTQLEDQANHLALLEWQLKREEGDVTEMKAEQKELAQQALADRKEIMQLALDAINSKLEQSVVDDILETDSLEDAISKFSSAQTFEWSDPYSLGGDYVQKNTRTGEIRTAVNMSQTQIADDSPSVNGIQSGGQIIKFTNDELKILQAIGADNFNSEVKNILLNVLTASERNKFMKDWKAEQEKRGQSLDPVLYMQEWATQQEGDDENINWTPKQ